MSVSDDRDSTSESLSVRSCLIIVAMAFPADLAEPGSGAVNEVADSTRRGGTFGCASTGAGEPWRIGFSRISVVCLDSGGRIGGAGPIGLEMRVVGVESDVKAKMVSFWIGTTGSAIDRCGGGMSRGCLRMLGSLPIARLNFSLFAK